MATLGNSKQIIVGAAQIFVGLSGALEYSQGSGSASVYNFSGSGSASSVPAFVANTAFADTVEAASTDWRNVGYTSNGLELQITPDFGEVQVDQVLDTARMFKQGMKVSLATVFAEATLANLAVAANVTAADYDSTSTKKQLYINSGSLGEIPLERALIAVGPGTGDPEAIGNSAVERIYIANRAISIEAVTATAKRDAPSAYEVSFRLLPANNGNYGKLVDRTVSAT